MIRLSRRIGPTAYLGLALLLAAPGNSPAETTYESCSGPRRAQGRCTPTGAVSLAPFRRPYQPYAFGTPSPLKRKSATPVLIEGQRYRPISHELGEWSGIVRGSGEVRLALQIVEQGRVTATRWIGSVVLANEPSSFHFRGPIPSGQGWDWRIVASSASSTASP